VQTMWERSNQVYFSLLGVALVVATMIVPAFGPDAGMIRTRTTRCMTPEQRASVPLSDRQVVARLLDMQARLDGVAGAEEARQMAYELMSDFERDRGIEP
jgi:hypothetical protein